MKWTPGKWHYRKPSQHVKAHLIISFGDPDIMSIAHLDPLPEREGNGVLISLAPRMAEALQRIAKVHWDGQNVELSVCQNLALTILSELEKE